LFRARRYMMGDMETRTQGSKGSPDAKRRVDCMVLQRIFCL
jgi:hypothetical protein